MLVLDNDQSRVVFSSISLSVAESGLMNSFEIRLSSNPDQNFGEGNAAYWINVTIHDTTDAFASPSFVSFSVPTWNISQTVRVAAKDDHVDEMFESQELTFFFFIASNAYKFADLVVEPLLVSIEDDEDSACVTIY